MDFFYSDEDCTVSASNKQKVSAREVLTDIRAGMDNRGLKSKYGLSDKGLQSLFRKMGASGLLSEREVQMRQAALSAPAEPYQEEPRPGKGSPKPAKHPAKPPKSRPTQVSWQCPACNASTPEEVTECPACGVIVAKYLALQEREKEMRELESLPDSTFGTPWIVLLCGIVAFVIIGAAWLFWPSHEVPVPQQPSPAAGKPPFAGRPEKQPVLVGGKLIALEYSRDGNPLGLSVGQGSGVFLFETPSPNQGFRKLPPETGVQRYYDELKVAGQAFLLLTEGSKPPKMYLDANRNGDLTDDPGPFVGESEAVVPNHYTLELPYLKERIRAPYRMWFFPSRMGGIGFYPKCHWQGHLELNGKKYKVVTFDGNADGDYSNDVAVIDGDNDGKASKAETLKPGQSIRIDATDVKLLSIAPSGRSVRLKL